jgi:hypothetical protein
MRTKLAGFVIAAAVFSPLTFTAAIVLGQCGAAKRQFVGFTRLLMTSPARR